MTFEEMLDHALAMLQRRGRLRDGAEIMSRFMPACMIAPAREYFFISIMHCLQHVGA